MTEKSSDEIEEIKELNFKEVVDFHTHVYPQGDLQKSLVHSLARQKSVQKIYEYYSLAGHLLQEKMYLLPNSLRRSLDSLALISVVPPLLLKSHLDDLLVEMQRNRVAECVIAAHPPLISNDFVLEAVRESRALTRQSNKVLRPCLVFCRGLNWADMSDKFLLKVNPLAVETSLDDSNLHQMLSKWQDLRWPLLLHTGTINSPFFKTQSRGDVRDYESIIKKYDQIQFVLLHANIFQPEYAVALAQKYSNTFLTTSWQSKESVVDFVKKIGSERVLFSSDWPLLGNNIEVKLSGLRSLVANKQMSAQEFQNICRINAGRLLGDYFSKKL